MRALAHDIYTYPLPPRHRFPLGKYRLVRRGAEASGRIAVADARPATRAELLLAHSPSYLYRIERGELSRREQLALGLPWSSELVERARRSVVVAATQTLRRTGLVRRVLVVDLDVHQGDGTQAAFSGDPEAFTC